MLTKAQIELIIYSLTMRRNYIETGETFMSARDVVDYNSHVIGNNKKKEIETLDDDQRKLVKEIDDLIAYLRRI